MTELIDLIDETMANFDLLHAFVGRVKEGTRVSSSSVVKDIITL